MVKKILKKGHDEVNTQNLFTNTNLQLTLTAKL